MFFMHVDVHFCISCAIILLVLALRFVCEKNKEMQTEMQLQLIVDQESIDKAKWKLSIAAGI